MYEGLENALQAQNEYSKNMIDSLPQELHGPAVDLLVSESPSLKQIAEVAYHNGREAAYREMKTQVDSALAQAALAQGTLYYLYDNVSDATRAEIGILLLQYKNANNN